MCVCVRPCPHSNIHSALGVLLDSTPPLLVLNLINNNNNNYLLNYNLYININIIYILTNIISLNLTKPSLNQTKPNGIEKLKSNLKLKFLAVGEFRLKSFSLYRNEQLDFA